MILTEFPNYEWLKRQAEASFQNTHAPQELKLKKEGWPLVMLNTQTTHCSRPDIKGPFSIFTNLSGNSYVTVGNRKVKVTEDCFFITNREQYYSLYIDSTAKVETFNLHLGQNAWEDYVYAQSHCDSKLLDNPFGDHYQSWCDLPNALQWKSEAISQAIKQLQQLKKEQHLSQLQLQENLVPLFQVLFQQQHELIKKVNSLPSVKAGTRAELYKRIAVAADYVLSNPDASVMLEELAQLACMSKFHFLRTFKTIYRTTPHQFILLHKLRRSQRLLARTRMPVNEVATVCGFDELSSFSRAFKKYTGYTPQAYRLQAN